MDASNMMEIAVSEVQGPKVTPLVPGTKHYIVSEIEQPFGWEEKIKWITCADQINTELVYTVCQFMSRPEPHRITIAAVGQFVGVMDRKDIFKLIEELLETVNGTKHQLGFTTVRYTPASFMYWSLVSEINKFLWEKASQHGFPILNLHRSFQVKQGQKWAVAPRCFEEFVDGVGFGSTLSPIGLERYQSRLIKFHAAAYDVETACTQKFCDTEPIPLADTYTYVENEATRELLLSLGFTLKERPVVKPKKNKKKGKELSVQSSVPAAVAGTSAAPAVDGCRAVKRPKLDGFVNRGRGRARVKGPAEFETMPVLKGTLADMLIQIHDLREDLKEARSDADRYRKKRDSLERDLKISEREVRASDFRCAEYDRWIARRSEEHHQECEDWRQVRAELRLEVADLKDDLEAERERVHVLEGKLSVYEAVAKKPRKTRGASRSSD